MENNKNTGGKGPAKPIGRFEKLFSNRWFAAVVSLLLAALLWLVVIAQEPTQSRTLSVPINYEYGAAAYTSHSLDIMEVQVQKVDVTVSGDSSTVNGVKVEDIMVTPDYTGVETAGEYSLKLIARSSDTTLARFNVDSVSPAYTQVTFAQMDTKRFPVTVDASVTPVDGYFIGGTQASPSEVTLRGPVDELARVARVVAHVESDEPRDRTMLDSAPLEFLDADGNPVTETSIVVLETDQVEVTIPVLKLKEVPLVFEFTNVPAGYDTDELNAQISPRTIRIAGAADVVDAIESVSAGYINLTRLQLGRSETLKISLSEGLTNVDSVQEATVAFNTAGYDTRTIEVSDIRVTNVPSGVSVEAITESLQNVTLVGRKSELEALSPADVVAQVDASAGNISVKGKGQQQFSAQIIVTGTQTVFAIGSYPVLCDVATS